MGSSGLALVCGTFFSCGNVFREEAQVLKILERARKSLEQLRLECSLWEQPEPVLARHTELVDGLVRDLFGEIASEALRGQIALVAVGGYGRGELTPWSDVDLMFLCRDTSSQEVLEAIYRMLHAMWDLHLEVGHSVRTVEDCLEVSLRDIPTWTALLDGRLLAGDRELFEEFRRRMARDLLAQERQAFVKGLVGSIRERHKTYSRAPFLLEPHLKNGPGGLRDYQSALWLARVAFPVTDLDDMVVHALISQEEAEEISRARRFIWQARLAMHRATGRKEDRLTFELQELLADVFRTSGSEGLPVERFMREYYRNATQVRYLVEDCIQKVTDPSLAAGPDGPSYVPESLGCGFQVIRGRLTLVDEGAFSADPASLMEAISFAHCRGLALDLFTRDEIKASLHLVDAGWRRSRRVRDAFLEILDSQDCGYGALQLMHRLGLLQVYIPEFSKICFQVQHDAYHAYTVDVHSMETVRELALIRSQEESGQEPSLAKQVAGSIGSWRGLILAALLHDIGKGDGSGHAVRGAQLVRGILERWWMPQSEIEEVVFLVREHITLMDTALGRDLTEEKVVVDLCRVVGSLGRLDQLYLLTLADLRATGPDLLTQWKDQLLKELYLKARRILETGELVSPRSTSKVLEAREIVRSVLASRMSQETLDEWIEALPSRYLLTTPQELLPEQVLLAFTLVQEGNTVRLHARMWEDHQEILVCTRDAPGLFSRICGVMVAHGLNILGARIHTWGNGIAMDSFRVEPLGEGSRAALDGFKVREMERDLASVLEGKLELQELMGRRAKAPMGSHRRYPAVRPRVRIDNQASDFYTVVEVRATDRFGLLFAITSALAGLELGVHVAIIDTRRGQVMDVFYVQDANGQKVWEESKLAATERTLYQALERLEESGIQGMCS